MVNSIIKNKISVCVIACVLFASCLTQKEKAANRESIKQALEDNNFTFVAQQVSPLRGNIVSPRLLQLDGSYNLKVSKDTIDCYLPYFGVAQRVDYGTRDTGLQFVTTDFSYDKKLGKKGGYEITIIPRNSDKTRQLFLTISESGSATLNVLSYNRDAISFNGVIEAK